jgi:transposase
VSDQDLAELNRIASDPQTPAPLLLRVRVVIHAAKGLPNYRLAEELKTTTPTIRKWRRRYEAKGVPGLLTDAPRSGRPKKVKADLEKQIQSMFGKASTRTVARELGISRSTVHRIWRAQSGSVAAAHP